MSSNYLEPLEDRCHLSTSCHIPLLRHAAPAVISSRHVGHASPAAVTAMPLSSVKSFMYLINGNDQPGIVSALAKTSYDMLVVDPTFTVRGDEDFNAKGMVSTLHAGKPGRLVLAYLDIGEAENYRTYWQRGWRPATARAAGNPSFILESDPDGWSGNYPVAYWDQRWQDLYVNNVNSVVKQVMAAGFDGVYLDWVEAYDDPVIMAAARRQGVNPAQAMVDFIGRIRAAIRQINPRAVVIGQNAPYLLTDAPGYAQVIDGAAFEDTWYGGAADAAWGNPAGGDIPNRYADESSTAALLRQYARYKGAGKAVFTIDYCLNRRHASAVYQTAAKLGLVPLVTQVDLSQITPTPPPWLK